MFKAAGSAALVGAAIPTSGLVLAAANPAPMKISMEGDDGAVDMRYEERGNYYTFFNPVEAAFIEAAMPRLISADEICPSAYEADVAIYIDRQLSGAWGAGERFYSSGPWQQGVKIQGYELPLLPLISSGAA